MDRSVETLASLGQGQRVRLTFGDGTADEMRVNQIEHVPGEAFRLELTTDESGGAGRYQVDAAFEDGAWATPAVRRYDPAAGAWTTLAGIAEITPLEMFGTVQSADMAAQAATGTGAESSEGPAGDVGPDRSDPEE